VDPHEDQARLEAQKNYKRSSINGSLSIEGIKTDAATSPSPEVLGIQILTGQTTFLCK